MCKYTSSYCKKTFRFFRNCFDRKSYEEILERNIKSPRWGNTHELQALEAKTFFEIERPHYKAEAEKYGYEVFENYDDAFNKALTLI